MLEFASSKYSFSFKNCNLYGLIEMKQQPLHVHYIHRREEKEEDWDQSRVEKKLFRAARHTQEEEIKKKVESKKPECVSDPPPNSLKE